MDDTLAEIQAKYGESCSRYEEKASTKLASSDTIVISGFGCSLSVKHDALRIYPGRTHKDQQQDTVMLYRGVHDIKQIILLSDKGEITLDAIRWSIEQGIAIMMIDGRGNLMQSLTPEHESYAALRRAQYYAIDTGMDLYIAREIVREKVVAQIATLKRKLFPYERTPMRQAVERAVTESGFTMTDAEEPSSTFQPVWYYLEEQLLELPNMKSLDTIRMVEARCGVIYWYSFLGMPIKWTTTDAKKVPPHWLHITRRASPLSTTRTPQRATNPYQAVTNYAYAILQGQCNQAVNAQGFDQLVLKMFASTTLSKGDFMSSKTGEVIFNPQFARFIAALCRIPQSEVDATVSWIKGLLIGS
jgi:CRISPR/Cas system-associated endonuclease Cas1